MAIRTGKDFVQEVLYELYGGITGDDSRISERFVLTKLNDQIASLAVINAYTNNNLEGVTYADDYFYTTFSNITVSTDTAGTGLKYALLPSHPISLPSERQYRVYPVAARGGISSTTFKMIKAGALQRVISQPKMKKVYCFVQDGKMNFYVSPTLSPLFELNAINITMATAAVGMDTDLNLPQDMIALAKKNILAELRATIGTPQDRKNDGIEVLEN